MTPSEVLEELWKPVPAAAEDQAGFDLRGLLGRHGPGGDEGPTWFARLMRVARHADRRGAAAIAGHQAAIRRLFPATPDDAVVAFCVSEDQGPRPSHINTTLIPDDNDAGSGDGDGSGDGSGDGFVLEGHKRWGSLSPLADLCYVAASVGRDPDTGQNRLRMVAVPTCRPGVTLDREPYANWGDDHPLADLHFGAVAIGAAEVLPGDGYTQAIKPFRLIEDVYNTAGVLIGLFGLGRRLGWPDERLERLAALVVAANAIAETDMASPPEVLLLSDFLAQAEAEWSALASALVEAGGDVAAKWRPDQGLLGVAAAARRTRRERAWEQLR